MEGLYSMQLGFAKKVLYQFQFQKRMLRIVIAIKRLYSICLFEKKDDL